MHRMYTSESRCQPDHILFDRRSHVNERKNGQAKPTVRQNRRKANSPRDKLTVRQTFLQPALFPTSSSVSYKPAEHRLSGRQIRETNSEDKLRKQTRETDPGDKLVRWTRKTSLEKTNSRDRPGRQTQKTNSEDKLARQTRETNPEDKPRKPRRQTQKTNSKDKLRRKRQTNPEDKLKRQTQKKKTDSTD